MIPLQVLRQVTEPEEKALRMAFLQLRRTRSSMRSVGTHWGLRHGEKQTGSML